MVFDVALYLSILIFLFGLTYKMSSWFRYTLDSNPSQFTARQKVFAAIKGITTTVFSRKMLILLKVFIVDIVLLAKTWRSSKLRWLMHILIFWGFLLLLLLHAFDTFITASLFSDYYPSLNPFLFLRDLFGALVFAGIGIAIFSRFIVKKPRTHSSSQDIYAISILTIILLSGIVLKGTMMTSYTEFKTMVEDYSGLSFESVEDNAVEIEALESYWVNNFALVSPNVKKPFDDEVLKRGMTSHEINCVSCHSPSQWAFLSYASAKTISPVARVLDTHDVSKLLWYIHFMACFIGLAYLPFSKMFHIIVVPISLFANAVMKQGESDPANMETKQIMELDACTHCGACTMQCRVGIAFEEIPNSYILPSEKIAALKALVEGKEFTDLELHTIQDGLYLCTNCYQCTEICPSGIDLQRLWFNAREALIQKGRPEFFIFSPLSFYRGIMHASMTQDQYEKPLHISGEAIFHQFDVFKDHVNLIKPSFVDHSFQKKLLTSIQGNTSFSCYTCTTCSVVCPVVRNYDNPLEELGLLPHQIIHAANMGICDLAFRSKMLWSCLGCYECQDDCPQGVRVTDVFFELKNLAIQYLSDKKSLFISGAT